MYSYCDMGNILGGESGGGPRGAHAHIRFTFSPSLSLSHTVGVHPAGTREERGAERGAPPTLVWLSPSLPLPLPRLCRPKRPRTLAYISQCALAPASLYNESNRLGYIGNTLSLSIPYIPLPVCRCGILVRIYTRTVWYFFL